MKSYVYFHARVLMHPHAPTPASATGSDGPRRNAESRTLSALLPKPLARLAVPDYVPLRPELVELKRRYTKINYGAEAVGKWYELVLLRKAGLALSSMIRLMDMGRIELPTPWLQSPHRMSN